MPRYAVPTPSLSLDSRVRIPSAVLFQELAGEMVLLDLEGGTYFGLDETGTRIWQLLAERRPLRAIHTALVDEYDVDAHQLEADLLRLVREFTRHGLVEHA